MHNRLQSTTTVIPLDRRRFLRGLTVGVGAAALLRVAYPVEADAPVVLLHNGQPLNGQVIPRHTTIQTAVNDSRKVKRVHYRSTAGYLGSATQAPYEKAIALPEGRHKIQVAVRFAGNGGRLLAEATFTVSDSAAVVPPPAKTDPEPQQDEQHQDHADPSEPPPSGDFVLWSALYGSTPRGVVQLRGNVLLDVNATVEGVVVPEGTELRYDPDASAALRSRGNVVVNGRLTMRPSSARYQHRLEFIDVNQSRFAGGGMDVLASDVGLWVMGQGTLDVQGQRKTAWRRATRDQSWASGDDLVQLGEGWGPYAPETLNLTRNVVIAGTSKGYAHVFVHSARPQTLRYAELRYLGVDTGNRDSTIRSGRYPLHMHMCGDGSRGSVVEGVVVRDSGAHAFVPHGSHGITFTDCIAYNIVDDAYWWDPRLGRPNDVKVHEAASNEIFYDRCVAARVRTWPDSSGKPHRLTGFRLGTGNGCVTRGCVAYDVSGARFASGFSWPEGPQSVWLFEDNVAHHCANGIFVWQNSPHDHVISRFVAYSSGSGIEHGAYSNRYRYEDLHLADLSRGGVVLWAMSRGKADSERIRFQRARIEDTSVAFLLEKFNKRRPKIPAVAEDVVLANVKERTRVTKDGRGASVDQRIVFRSTGKAAPRSLKLVEPAA